MIMTVLLFSKKIKLINIFITCIINRCVSNPLVRGYSNVSVSSDNEGAHFVPFGRGHDSLVNAEKSGDLDLTAFEFSPNIAGLTLTDSLGNPDVNCITPLSQVVNVNVKSKVPSMTTNNIPIQRTQLGPLEDIDGHSTDFDARTDRTGTSDAHSSQIASSQDGLMNNNRTLPEDHLNVDAQEFVPKFGGIPTQQ